MTPNSNQPGSIPGCFAGQTIFITGGTGFMGKLLVEKLLRCCPDVEKIYLLARPKRNRSVQERWSEMTQLPIFDVLRSNNPDSFKKVHTIAGNIEENDLGISHEDLQTLTDNVTIVYHAAAMIQFTDNLYSVLVSNTRATHVMLNIAKKMKKLQLFVYVSSAYSNMNLPCEQAEERVIPACQDWRVILHLLEKDSVGLASLKEKLMGGHPNPYTWSKSLAEQIVNEHSQYFPTLIVRPAIVSPTFKDPFPGWADILCGIAAICVPIGLGLIRIVYTRPECYQDYVPADTAINAILVATYVKRLNPKKGETDVYNCGVVKEVPVTTDILMKDSLPLIESYPSKYTIWPLHFVWTTNDFWYHFLFLFLQVIPGVLGDIILSLIGRKPRLLKLTKKMSNVSRLFKSFSSNQIAFPNDKFKQLENYVSEEDKQNFSISVEGLTQAVVMEVGFKSALQYYLKEDLSEECLERNRRRIFWLKIIDKCLIYTFTTLAVYFLVRCLATIEIVRDVSFILNKALWT